MSSARKQATVYFAQSKEDDERERCATRSAIPGDECSPLLGRAGPTAVPAIADDGGHASPPLSPSEGGSGVFGSWACWLACTVLCCSPGRLPAAGSGSLGSLASFGSAGGSSGGSRSSLRWLRHVSPRRMLEAARRAVRSWCTCYLVLHIFYIVMMAVVGAVVLYILENTLNYGRNGELKFLDALFQTVSAVTGTGLTTVDISQWSMYSLMVLVSLSQLCGVCLFTCLGVTLLRYLRVRSMWKQHKRHTDINYSTNEHVEKTASTVFPFDYKLEYKALGRLAVLVVVYQWGLQIICFLVLGLYLQLSSQRDLLTQRNTNPWWWSAFHTVSAFNNAGFALFQDGLEPFQDDYCVLLVLSFLILAGNTQLPVFLRFFVFMVRNLSGDRKLPKHKQILRYVLTHAGRCSLHIFSGIHTKLLLFVFLVLNASDIAGFAGFERNATFSCVFLLGLFLAVSSRTAGFGVLDMSQLPQPLLFMYVGSMYISAYPVACTQCSTALPQHRQIFDVFAMPRWTLL
eukprot:TRINITY_DN1199_c0_g1_i2.p1 TRINITY_DN1199_c0_g1~~TRINITY_DN1199_c0_g1_i2.p1  ORF type:complete len:515 (-),score=93.30 TRINITY_DN1199_c0_g1_i2:487-2031(-)